MTQVQGSPKVVYAVGVWEQCYDDELKFILDRVYESYGEAVARRDECGGRSLAWEVVEIPLGGSFLDWRFPGEVLTTSGAESD